MKKKFFASMHYCFAQESQYRMITTTTTTTASTPERRTPTFNMAFVSSAGMSDARDVFHSFFVPELAHSRQKRLASIEKLSMINYSIVSVVERTKQNANIIIFNFYTSIIRGSFDGNWEREAHNVNKTSVLALLDSSTFTI
jgi:hypothetical protein